MIFQIRHQSKPRAHWTKIRRKGSAVVFTFDDTRHYIHATFVGKDLNTLSSYAIPAESRIEVVAGKGNV